MAVEIVMPHLSDSMQDGMIVAWLVTEGDTVSEGDPLVEVETDKATVTYEAECAGTVLSLAAAEGENVAVGAVIAVVGAAGESVAEVGGAGVVAAPAAGAAVSLAVSPSLSPAVTPPQGGRAKASPLARRVAAALGVDLAAVSGTGHQGRVVRADVELYAGRALSEANGAAALNGAAATGDGGAIRNGSGGSAGKGEATVERLSRLQQTIARRMSGSRASVPDFELRRELDLSAVVALREQLREVTEQPPSYNDFLVKAAALALREFPRVNGAYRDDAFESYARVNVGIAVAAEDALVVPTIFDADRKSLSEIGASARALAAKVRDGSITPAELDGGTFSISNLGMYGLDSFSAVINPPQAAILAVGALKPRPVVASDGVTLVARPTIHVTLACDHRILYGADGARFLERFDQLLQTPLALLL